MPLQLLLCVVDGGTKTEAEEHVIYLPECPRIDERVRYSGVDGAQREGVVVGVTWRADTVDGDGFAAEVEVRNKSRKAGR